MGAELSLGEFSEIVGAIYAAALDPPQWTTVARLVAEATDSVLSAFVIQDNSTQQVPTYFAHGLPVGYVETYHRMFALNPLLPNIALSVPGEILVNSHVQSEAEFTKGLFYREFVAPLGLRDCMSITCLRSGPRFAGLVANSSARRELYTSAEIGLMRLLAPHLCRAITISDALDLRTLKSDALQSALDGLTAGVFMVDAAGRVVHQNRAAEAMAIAARIVTVRENRLWPVHAASRQALNDALARGADSDIPALPELGSIPLLADDAAGRGMIATLLPLEREGRVSVLEPFAARWAVFVQNPHVAMPMPGEAFGRLYMLTPAELRVALALAPGLSPEEAASMLGLALPTVRTHLQRIYAKTNTNRQIDLVRLMLSTMPPVGGGGATIEGG